MGGGVSETVRASPFVAKNIPRRDGVCTHGSSLTSVGDGRTVFKPHFLYVGKSAWREIQIVGGIGATQIIATDILNLA